MDNHEGQEAYSQRYKLSVGRLDRSGFAHRALASNGLVQVACSAFV
jgi:hypothetical protein